jgi:hypothetical protein
MTSDVLKTIAGLVVIALIVVATFMYGNAQREAQQKRDQAAKVTASPSPSGAGQVGVTSTPTPKPATTPATAAVATPSSNAIQGGQVAGTTTGRVGAGAAMPETGGELAAGLAAGAMGLAFIAWRRSRRQMALALARR